MATSVSSEATAEEMENELYIAATEGKVEILVGDKSNEYLHRKTYEKNNIIHIAIRHEQHDFIKACLIKFQKNDVLFSDKNSKENTPLHVAAEVGNSSIVELLHAHLGDINLWRVKNIKGNTPLHVALIHNNVKFAKILLEKDSYLAQIVNKSMEAPLHLAIKQHVNYSESELIMAKVRKPINEGGAALSMKTAPQEDMSEMIKLLVQKASIVTCWPDAKGSTPLHKVASLITPHNVELTKFILDNCRQSAEVCDNSGNSILHLLVDKIPNYQDIKILLSRREMYVLRNYQDHQGNTPLHIAAKNKDINMVRFLLDSSPKLNVNNMEGTSAASVIQRQDVLQMLTKRTLTKDEIEATDRVDITFLRKRMRNLGTDFLLSQDSKGKNILHRIMVMKKESRVKRHDFVSLIEEALESEASLISQRDSKGDTPIHVLVRNHPNTKIYVDDEYVVCSSLWRSGLLSSLIEKCNQCIHKIKYEAIAKKARFDSPWLVQNVEGNTALHEALRSNNSNIDLVKLLLKYDKKSVNVVNNNKETPFHLFASRPGIEQFHRDEIKEIMVDANVEVAFSLDKDGLTPLLRAAKAGNHPAAAVLCKASPKAAVIGDANRQTYGHLLVKHPSVYYFSRLFKDVELRKLLILKDKNGNTPLHLAIMNNRFDLVRDFLHFWKDERKPPNCEDQWILDILEIQNNGGISPNDLLAESPNLPNDIVKRILDEKKMIGVLSKWGIPSREMKTYVNTIGIIAALLTTITFTTAFTIPGGFLQDVGTPVLIENIPFQGFMILDVLAMCLSMMVLCCLLWIMATNNRKNSVMILDFSVTLVLASFFTTLLTFMAGVCATTLQVKPWMAYVSLGLCSLLMVVLYFSKYATVICERKFFTFSRRLPKLHAILNLISPRVGSKQIPRQGSLNIV